MLQTLKRVYLYTGVTFALLLTAGFGISLLITLFHAAGLLPRYFDGTEYVTETYLSPTSQQVLDSVVFFVVVLVVAGLLFGGGHYWLIRRDARGDPQADAGPTRHTFLNGLLALSALIAVPAGLAALAEIEPQNGSSADIAVPLAFALVFALVFLLVALERVRVRLAGRPAGIIRQIHENALQIILLFTAISFLAIAITTLIQWLLVTGNLAVGNCFNQPTSLNTIGTCPPSVVGPVLDAIFALAAWGLYVWLGRWAWGSPLERVAWFIAFGYGLIWLLVGVQMLVNTIAATPFGVGNAWQPALNNGLPFIGTMLTGIVIALLYLRWLLSVYNSAPLAHRRSAARQGVLAIAAALSSLFFLSGAVEVLDGLVEQLIPNGMRLDANGWAVATSVLVAGLGYLPLWLALRRTSDPAQAGPVIPRRAYVLAVLIYTAIPAVIALVVLIVQLVAIPLNLDIANAPTARFSAVAFLVLGVTAIYHLLRLLTDLRLNRVRAATAPPEQVSYGATLVNIAPDPLATTGLASAVPAPGDQDTLVGSVTGQPMPAERFGDQDTLVSATTLESILQEVAAGTVDTTTAAARIRSLLASS